ncbi:hypothetical protein KAH81_06285 [bacterium]|nr:hypothetical protein [bacterium]
MRNLIFFSLIVLFIGSALAVDWPTPSDLEAYSGLSGRIDLTWNAAPPVYTNDTLSYDTGLTGGGGYADLDSGYYSVRFSPAGPCSILTINSYFFAAGGDRIIRYHFWDVSEFGFPDIYANLVPPIPDNTIGTGWNNKDVSSRGIVFDGLSDFYLGIDKQDTIPELGIAVDDTIGATVRSYRTDFYYGGNFPTSGDLLIRVVVVYLEDHSVATLTGTVGKLVTPLVPFAEPEEFLPEMPIPERFDGSPIAMAPHAATYPTSYSIYRTNTWSDPLSLSFHATIPGSLTTYSDHGVIDGSTYYYSIRADFDGGVSAMPDTVYATPYSGTAATLYDTFMVDDGTPDAGVHYEDAVLANKFHVDTRCKIIRIQYQVNTPGYGIPKVYLADGLEPGREALGEDTPYALSEGWNNINVSGYRAFVEGDFWVGLEMGGAVGLSLDATTPGFAWDRSPEGMWNEISDTTYFIRAIVQYSTDNAYYHLYPGWNAISLPVIPSMGLRADDIFPFAVGGEIYGWDANTAMWSEAEMLEPGKGYFVLCARDTFYNISGIPIHEYNLPWAGPSWEFIGGLSDFGGIDTSDISTTPSDLWSSPRIAYYWEAGSHRWNFSSKIMPSYAYFILLNSEGLINADD